MPACSGYSAYLTAKNYESNQELDLQRSRPDPIADLKEYASIFLSTEDFRHSLITSKSHILKAQPSKKHDLTSSKLEKYHPNQQPSTPKKPNLAQSNPNIPGNFTSDIKSKIPFRNGKHSEVQNGQNEKIHAQHQGSEEISQKTNEKLLYLFSSEHRSTLRREENEKLIESQAKQTQMLVTSDDLKKSTKLETSPGLLIDKIMTKENPISGQTGKSGQKPNQDQSQEFT